MHSSLSFGLLTLAALSLTGPLLLLNRYSSFTTEITVATKEDEYALLRSSRIEALQRRARLLRKPLVSQSNQLFWDMYPPELSCNLTERVGSLRDGGKFVCDLHRLPKGCVVYSLGSNNEISFEQEIRGRTSCKIFVSDPTVKPSQGLLETADRFLPWAIAAEDGAVNIGNTQYVARSIPSMMREMNHTEIAILKVDIEGAEWKVLESLFGGYRKRGETPPFIQILVELHLCMNSPRGACGPDFHFASLLFDHLWHLGYIIFSKESNLYAPQTCFEYSFARHDYLNLPHPSTLTKD